MYSRYHSRYSIRAQVDKGRKPQAPERPVAWSAETVWAAAAYAHRINGRQYFKTPEYEVNSQGIRTGAISHETNRSIMRQALQDESVLTQEDRALGLRARDWLSKEILVKALKNTLSDFEKALQTAVSIDDFDEWNSRMELAVIASQIRSYEEAIQLETAMTGLDRSPVAAVGEKVETDIRVIKSVYSQNYGVYFVTGLTPASQAVFFSYRERLGVGHACRIRGTVKAHRENSTQLNRVRIV